MNQRTLKRIFGPLAVGAAAALFGFVPLMGLPGGFVAELTGLLFGFSGTLAAYGPSVWGLAIFVTWFAAAGIPVGCWLLWAMRPAAGMAAWIGAGLAGYVVAGAITTIVIVTTSPPAEVAPR